MRRTCLRRTSSREYFRQRPTHQQGKWWKLCIYTCL
jgi:hypothetical protein